MAITGFKDQRRFNFEAQKNAQSKKAARRHFINQ